LALSVGQTAGPYQITAPLGAGGMGEVYRATDPRLGRDVALKLLPEAFAADPDRLARFEREAKVLASPDRLARPAREPGSDTPMIGSLSVRKPVPEANAW